VLEREGIDGAWVGHLPSAWYREPSLGNRDLYQTLRPHRAVLRPAPAIRPDWPRWEEQLRIAEEEGAQAVRAYPAQWGLGARHPALTELAIAAGERRLPIVLTVRFEDLRQRHALDVAPDLDAATIREIARSDAMGADRMRIVVTCAGHELVEEVHWGLTSDEQQRVLWDISWIWGPPDDHFARLIGTIGAERFVFGSQWPLRLIQTPRALLDLLPGGIDAAQLRRADALFGDGSSRPGDVGPGVPADAR
jgi:hypothetical protein